MTAGCTAARALMDYAISRGCDRGVLTERSGIDPAQLRDVEGRVPLANYLALMSAGRELCNDPAFALHFGESDAGMESTLACMMGVFSPSMAGTLAQDMSDDRLEITRDGNDLFIVDLQHDDFPELTESSFARVVCAARQLFAGAEFVKAVYFKHAEPPYRAEYDRVFRIPIVFGHRRNAMRVDASWLEQKPEEPRRRVVTMMKGRATRARVEQLLERGLRTADVSSDAVARRLGMSRQTLFRRLRSEGVTFKQVLDELRQKLAMQHLDERNLAVSETAYLLGFSDSASFSRAFKRWTGHSPRRGNGS